MTAYKNFIKDFPCRCRDILKIASRPAQSQGREVTLALIVASAGLVVPYERLKPDGRWGPHPSGDSRKFADAAEKLKSILNQPFTSSRLWTEGSSTWFGGKLDSVADKPDCWKGLQRRRPISQDKKVGTILGVIRNALAHGNIWTRRDPIKEIIFVKSVTDDDEIVPKFLFVSVAPDEFRNLLENWFDLLIELHIPREVAFEALKNAA